MAAKPTPSMTTRSLRWTSVRSFHDLHLRRDRRIGLGVVLAQEFQRAVGEHHAEAEGGVGRILLDDGDIGARLTALDQVGEIEPGRPGAENDDAHATYC